jgi:hypothetical protein
MGRSGVSKDDVTAGLMISLAAEPLAALMLRLTGLDITRCPVCRGGRMRVVALPRPGALPVPVWDTS